MRKLIFLTFLFTLGAQANTGSNLLLSDSKEQIDLTSKIVVQKQLKLDNAFKVQLFGTWKAARIFDEVTNQWVELVLNDEIDKAIINYPIVLSKTPSKFKKTIKGVMPYLYWKKGLNHSFFNSWLELSANNDYLHTELGLALDHIIGYQTTDLILKNGFVFTDEQKNLLSKIENIESKINYSFQAWKNQRRGEESIKWVSKLPEKNPLRIKLLYTAINDYAQKGKLALSGQLIKKAIEPYIESTKSTSEISYYYLTLGRLLYQARAFDAAIHYYSLIPEKSKNFLQARVEMSWAYIQANNLAQAKAELASLNLSLFEDKFIPDVYLTSAIVNLKTCQFEEVQKNLNDFVRVNQKWAKKISNHLKAKVAKRIETNLFLKSHDRTSKTLRQEKEKISSLINKNIRSNNDVNKFYNDKMISIGNSLGHVKNSLVSEINTQWLNRSKMLDDAIYRMKFVRIEFLSQMRNLALNIPLSNTDKVSTYNSAPSRANDIEFPNDGILWGDDLFNMSAEVKNLCLKGLKK